MYADKLVNLDNLLIQLRDEITPHWQKFGLIVGVPQEIIAKYSEYPPDQCIIEILDYWLRHHNDGPLTWRDVAYALRKIKLCQLAEKILKVYVTGNVISIKLIFICTVYNYIAISWVQRILYYKLETVPC